MAEALEAEVENRGAKLERGFFAEEKKRGTKQGAERERRGGQALLALGDELRWRGGGWATLARARRSLRRRAKRRRKPWYWSISSAESSDCAISLDQRRIASGLTRSR